MRGKWTPGPWYARADHTVAYGSGVPLLRCYAGRNPVANAHLIAAAPALYEALEAVSTAFSVAHIAQGLDPAASESLRMARAALSLAHPQPKGEEA